MTQRNNEQLLNELVETLDLPDSAYEKAVKRYDDIGNWFGRPESSCVDNEPHIFPQGSFRLGIAIRPISGKEEYDLDLACNLRKGVSPQTHSQKDFKTLVGEELEEYRKYRGIQAALEEKHRCWRLEYADSLNFHMDIVPCIPEDEVRRKSIAASMKQYGIREQLANDVAEHAVGITDDRHQNYSNKVPDWMISNPEGYALWFTSKMTPTLGETLKFAAEAAQVDDVPLYKRKTPLQKVVQLLKRHRDTMYTDNSDSKPISVIITTLSAQSYNGTNSVEETLNQVLSGLKQFVDSDSDEVRNPVNPEENFADRWSMPAYKHLELKKNFHTWVNQAIRDFELLRNSTHASMITENISQSLSINTNEAHLSAILGLSLVSPSLASPRKVSEPPSKPWLEE